MRIAINKSFKSDETVCDIMIPDWIVVIGLLTINSIAYNRAKSTKVINIKHFN